MLDVYGLCPCGSGEKLKFCCYKSYKKGDFGQILKSSFKLPLYECQVIEGWEELGMTSVHVVRKLSQNSYVLVSFLVDTLCLGVKDIFVKMDISRDFLEEIYEIQEKEHTLQSFSYQDARSLILGALDYAENLGIAPYSEWNQVKAFIEGDLPYEPKFSFGKNGKPFYMGKLSDIEKYDIDELVATVEEHGGDWAMPASFIDEESWVES